MSKILVGVTGGVAAYKAVELISMLRKRKDEIKVVMTENATKFVSRLTFAAVGNCDVYIEGFTLEGGNVIHTTISKWADVMVIAPLTANTAAKLRMGVADNLLTMTALAFEGSKIAVPSMNVRMYDNASTVENLAILKRRGWRIIEPASGHLADGEYGKGRYPQNERVLIEIDRALSSQDLEGLRFLISAGPTREAIDPVRYISNRSSGKMGYEIAKAAWLRGAEVELISGPTCLDVPDVIRSVEVESAQEMKNAILERLTWADVVIMAAAVSDYKPAHVSKEKIKKTTQETHLTLVKTDDVLCEVSKRRKKGTFVVGFAAETENLLLNASKKIKEKSLDIIVANDVSRRDIGFDSDYNEVTILDKNGGKLHLARESKSSIAHKILDIVKSQRIKKI